LVIIRRTGSVNIDEHSLFVLVRVFNDDCESDLKVIGDTAGALAFNIKGVIVVAEVQLLPCGVGAMKLPASLEDDDL